MHADQLAVSSGVVRELVEEQFPSWRQLAITKVDAAGTVNAIFRIGVRLAARFPLRPGDATSVRRQLEAEAAAARELAGATRFAAGIPAPETPICVAVPLRVPLAVATGKEGSACSRPGGIWGLGAGSGMWP